MPPDFIPAYYEARIRELENRVNTLVATVDSGDDWTAFPAFVSSWGRGTGGFALWRKSHGGTLDFTISLRLIGTKTDATPIQNGGAWGDSSCWPVGGRYWPVSLNLASALFWSGNYTPFILFAGNGALSVYGVNATGLSQLDCHGSIPLVNE
jgi:hypothetical protein